MNFCSRCGSPVPNRFRERSLYSVPAGSIDGRPDIEVAAQIYLGSRAGWDHDILRGELFLKMPDLDKMLALLRAH